MQQDGMIIVNDGNVDAGPAQDRFRRQVQNTGSEQAEEITFCSVSLSPPF